MVSVALSGGEARVYKGSAFARAARPAHRFATPACATRMRGCAGRPASRMRTVQCPLALTSTGDVQLLSFLFTKTIYVTPPDQTSGIGWVGENKKKTVPITCVPILLGFSHICQYAFWQLKFITKY